MLVDCKSPDILRDLKTAQLCRRYGDVTARPANPGENVQTILADGTVEVEENIAKEGDWVISNPGGEQYILHGEKFYSRYEPTDQYGVYTPKGYCRAMPNPFGVDIEVTTSSGVAQHGDKFCFIVCASDANGKLDDELYLIGYAEFQMTYTPVV